MRAKEPKLNELDPKSIINVFSVINEFVEFDLNKLKTSKELNMIFNSSNYSIEEKFYIAFYLPKYLNIASEKTSIFKRIKEIEDLGDSEELAILDLIKEYADTISDACKTNLKKFKRQYNSNLKSNVIIEDEEKKLFNEISEWTRLPLNKEKRNEFLKFIYLQLTPFYLPENIKYIIENSFEILPFPNKIALMNFEIEKSSDIYRAFYNIYLEYRKRDADFIDIADNNQIIRSKPINQKTINNSNLKRAAFYPYLHKEQYKNATNKINIAKIMFLTFTKIRENYLIHSKKEVNTNLNDYLKTFCKNIKK